MPLPTSYPRPAIGRSSLFVLAISLLARGWVLYHRLAIQGIRPDQLVGSDVAGWLGIARHFYLNGDLSYWFLAARPPFFPATVALVYALGGNNLHAAILQTLFGALVPVVGYMMAGRLLVHSEGVQSPEQVSLVVGIALALDPASISTSATLLSEPLFNLTFTLCLLSLTMFVQDRHVRDLLLCGLWLALAMLTRPTAVFFWLVIPLILFLIVKNWWRPALVLAGIGLAVYLGWSYRNLHYAGVFTYTTQANYHLLFYRAVSAEHLATGRTVDDLYADYAREVYLAIGDPEAAVNAHSDTFFLLIVPDSPAEYAAIGRLARQKLLRYWPYALMGTGVGAVRMFARTDLLPGWMTPLEIAYHLVLYSAALWRAYQAYWRREWSLLLLTAIPILYVTGLTLASQVSGMDTRMRTPITPQIAILAVYGAAWLLARWTTRSTLSAQS